MSATDAASYRARSNTTGLDIQARVVPEGRLMVVVHVHVREKPAHRGEGRAKRRRIVT